MLVNPILITKADPRTEPIMSWSDLAELDPDSENSTEIETVSKSTDNSTKESPIASSIYLRIN